VVIEDAFLQRGQRVDVLHVGSTARHRGDDALDAGLVQVDQRQQVGGDVIAAGRNAVLRHHDLSALAQCRSQCGHRRLAEQHAHVGVQALLTQALDQGHGQQRVATQFEEVVVSPYPLDAQHLGPDGGHEGFALALGLDMGLLRRIGFGQSTTVQLAMAGERQLLQAHERVRQHVRRQAGSQRLAQRIEVDCAGFGEPGQQALATHQHHGMLDAGLGRHGRFDLAQFDAHAADLHLVIVAAQVVEAAVGIPAHQVAAAVHACARQAAERVGQETFLGQLRAVEIAPGDLAAADVQLAGDPHRHRLKMRVEHIDAGVGDRLADVQRTARQDLAGGGDHGGFGRPVVVHQVEARVAVELAQAVAADQQGAQGRVLALATQRLLGDRRRQEADLQRLLQPPVEQLLDVFVADVRRRQVQRGTGAQCRPHLPGHGVETETGHAGGALAGTQRECLAVPVHQVGQGLVLDHHALGLAGGAGGVDHIGQLMGIEPGHFRVAVGCRPAGGLIEVQPWQLAWQAIDGRIGQHQRG